MIAKSDKTIKIKLSDYITDEDEEYIDKLKTEIDTKNKIFDA